MAILFGWRGSPFIIEGVGAQEFAVELSKVFAEALLPLVLYCGLGAVADHYLAFETRTLGRLMVYVFLPPLIFSTLIEVQVDLPQVLRVVGFVLMILAAMAAAGWALARSLRLDAATTSGVTLASTFFNSVNLGFPMVLYAFGPEGLLLASILVAVNSIPHHVFGLAVAARGTLSTRATVRALLRMPFFYTLLLALACRWGDVEVPRPVLEPISGLGRAAIPLALICVGIELRRMQAGAMSKALAGTVVLRLIGAPLVAWGACELVGLQGLWRKVMILQASMPCAMMPIVYAQLFGGNVQFVSRAVFYSTLGSVMTIPVLLLFLR